ncbi:MAG: RNA methyltransferase [Bacteroidaceae bacterium]|nr:RNA methyltransferase [Bacteroidaceae bacterium]
MGENKISSLQNTKVKQLVALQQKSSERRKQGVFVVEGIRELQHCLNAGYTINSIFFCPELTDTGALSSLLSESIASYEVSPEVYEKIAYRGSTEGVIATVQSKQLALKDLHLSKQPLLIVLESVEKPGNLGAILRSADAASADAVIICDPLTDLYNPNLIRSSIGAIFSVPCIACSSDDCINFLKQNNINILTAQLQDSKLYYDTDMTCGTAIIMGTESTGLTDVWRKAADAHIRIPMLGQLDSLNVSVSAAILLFEAVRQRKIETSQSSKS